ncbi:hypothetical protein CAE01nite_08030 [Cellulomonas aerilata]|uniref:HAMP domain-containing protein n=1 Tax=Cellulomonas aerilata TaxID=515326 RepID=A0A512D9B5_9CELL|nr:hypothetical protein CAE01nite_08030 [Cellulomonas aerilata]
MAAAGVAAVGAAVLLARTLLRRLTVPLGDLNETAEALGSGDLAVTAADACPRPPVREGTRERGSLWEATPDRVALAAWVWFPRHFWCTGLLVAYANYVRQPGSVRPRSPVTARVHASA